MKPILSLALVLFTLSVNAQSKLSFTAETALTFDQYSVEDGSNRYGSTNGGPYLLSTNSTGFLTGLTARYALTKPFYVESGIYLKNDAVKVNMKAIGERSIGKHNTFLVPLCVGARLPIGKSRFQFNPSGGVSFGLPSGKKMLTGSFHEEPFTASRQRVVFIEHDVKGSSFAVFPELGLGGSYRLSEKLLLGLQTRFFVRVAGEGEQSGYYNAGAGDGYLFSATQKRKQFFSAGLAMTYEL